MLEGIITGKTAKPRRVVLHGVKGVGKSTWAAGAPAPVFVQAEDGLEDIGAPRFPKAESFEELFSRYQQLGEGNHEFRTVATDSLDGVERLIFAQVCKDHGKDNIEDIGYAKGYTFALDYWKKVLACLDYLRDEKGMNVILIAHSKIEKFEDPEQANYDRWTLQLHKHATAFITQWADEVFFATYRIFINKEKTGFGKEKIRATGAGQRLIYTTDRPGHVAKNRLDMPDEIDFPKVGGWDLYTTFIDKHHSGPDATAGQVAPPAPSAPSAAAAAAPPKEPKKRRAAAS